MACIAFFLPDLGGGGAEKLTLDLARMALERGHRVDIVLLRREGVLLSSLPPGVEIVDLGAVRILAGLLPLRRYMARAKPDVMIAAMWPITVIALLAAWWLANPPRVLVAEHCALSQQYAGQRMILGATIALAYRWADGIVGVSQGVSQDLARLGHLSPERITTIGNPVPPPACSGVASPWPKGGKRILAVGRLKAQKNHVLLIEAFALLPSSLDAVLVIVGDGEQRGLLEALVAARGLAQRVALPGYTSTPGDWFGSADLFVNSSDYEGLPLVMVEALACGLPIVATDCPCGPAEVLKGGEHGTLVPPGDASRLADAMHEALLDGKGSAGVIAARQRRAMDFAPELALDAYLALSGIA